MTRSSRPNRVRTAAAAVVALSLAAPAAAAVDSRGTSPSPAPRTVLGPRDVLDPSQVSTDSTPEIAAAQDYRQFPFVTSFPSGNGAARTLLLSYNVNMDSGSVAEKLQTKRSTDGGATWTSLTQAVPMTNTVRTKTGLLYSVNFRTSSTSTPPTPISATPGPVLEQPGVGGNEEPPSLSDTTSPDGTKPPYEPEPDVSLQRFTTRYWTSKDNGASWRTAAGSVRVPWSLTDLYFHRSIVIAPDGRWLATAYAHKTGDSRWSSFLLSSSDQGRTWTGVSEVGTRLLTWGEGVTEPTVEFNSRGQLVVAYRMAGAINPSVCLGSSQGNASVATAVSDDLGRTWSLPKQVVIPGTVTGSSDPHLLRAPTGQLLLSVGRPNNQVLVSNDGTGDSWAPSSAAANIRSSGYTSLASTGSANHYRLFGDLGSNWCYTPQDGPSRASGIFSQPFHLAPADGQTVNLAAGMRLGLMRLTQNTFTGALTPASRPEAVADSSVEPDAGLVSATDSGTFTFDLGKPYMVRGIGLAMPTAGASAGVELSADGARWTSAASWARSDAYRALTDRSFAPTRARYIRVSSSAASQALVSEMRVYTDHETFENDVPGTPPAAVGTVGVNAGASVLTQAGQGFESENSIRIQDNSSTGMPRLVKSISPTWNTSSGFHVRPSRLTTAMTITQNVRMPNGKVQRGMHLGIFPDGSVRRYNGRSWIVVARAGTVPMNRWSYFSVYSNRSGSEFNINGKLYSSLPRTTPGGVFTDTTISSGGTRPVGDDILIDNLSQK